MTLTIDERRHRIAAERAAWPTLYRSVAEAIDRGFWPDAYGETDDVASSLLRPPTKFAYPAGGLAHPHHINGPGAGSWFWAWTHANGSPDDLRHRPVWFAGDPSATAPGIYRTQFRLTLDQAFDVCIAVGEHHHAHFIVLDWVGPDRSPALTVAQWAELAAPDAPRVGAQLALFEPPPRDRLETVRRQIRDLLPTLPPGQQHALPIPYPGFDNLLRHANDRRIKAGIPDPTAPEASDQRRSA